MITMLHTSPRVRDETDQGVTFLLLFSITIYLHLLPFHRSLLSDLYCVFLISVYTLPSGVADIILYYNSRIDPLVLVGSGYPKWTPNTSCCRCPSVLKFLRHPSIPSIYLPVTLPLGKDLSGHNSSHHLASIYLYWAPNKIRQQKLYCNWNLQGRNFDFERGTTKCTRIRISTRGWIREIGAK